jgi:hypothetical protein
MLGSSGGVFSSEGSRSSIAPYPGMFSSPMVSEMMSNSNAAAASKEPSVMSRFSIGPVRFHTRRRPVRTAMQQLRIVMVGVWHGATEKGSLNDGQIPNFRGVRVHVSTVYNRVEGNRRASRNGRVSDLPPEIPNVTIRKLFTSL